MGRVRDSKAAQTVVVPVTMTYKALAARLGISKRTLIRRVVAGVYPAPQFNGRVSVFSSEAVEHILSGPSIPGSFEYHANERERKRLASIERKKESKRKGEQLRKRRQRAAARKAAVQS